MGTGSVLVVRQKMDLSYRSWKRREYFCPSRVLSLGAPAMFQSWIVCTVLFLQRKEAYTNITLHIKYSQNSGRRKESFIFCFAIFVLFQGGLTPASGCDKERGCAELTSLGCGPSHPLREGVYSAVLKRVISSESIW